jgi:hypothetical protein
MESADSQITMLTELAHGTQADDEGFVRVHRDHLIDSLERIQTDHRRELQQLPTVAGRMIAVFGVTV